MPFVCVAYAKYRLTEVEGLNGPSSTDLLFAAMDRSLKCLQLQLLISEMALKAHPIIGLHGTAGIQTNQMSPAES